VRRLLDILVRAWRAFFAVLAEAWRQPAEPAVAALAERYPGAPDHWLRDVAARAPQPVRPVDRSEPPRSADPLDGPVAAPPARPGSVQEPPRSAYAALRFASPRRRPAPLDKTPTSGDGAPSELTPPPGPPANDARATRAAVAWPESPAQAQAIVENPATHRAGARPAPGWPAREPSAPQMTAQASPATSTERSEVAPSPPEGTRQTHSWQPLELSPADVARLETPPRRQAHAQQAPLWPNPVDPAGPVPAQPAAAPPRWPDLPAGLAVVGEAVVAPPDLDRLAQEQEGRPWSA